jgi:hypothetical protein
MDLEEAPAEVAVAQKANGAVKAKEYREQVNYFLVVA